MSFNTPSSYRYSLCCYLRLPKPPPLDDEDPLDELPPPNEDELLDGLLLLDEPNDEPLLLDEPNEEELLDEPNEEDEELLDDPNDMLLPLDELSTGLNVERGVDCTDEPKLRLVRPDPKLRLEELLPLSDWRTVVRVLLSRLPKPELPRLDPKLLLSRREPDPKLLISRLEPEATPLLLRRMPLLSRREPEPKPLLSRREPNPELLFFCST